jgi:hypothetical protein
MVLSAKQTVDFIILLFPLWSSQIADEYVFGREDQNSKTGSFEPTDEVR